MNTAVRLYVTAISIAFLTQVVGQTPKPLDLTPKRSNTAKRVNCTTIHNLPGICVHKSHCTNAHDFIIGGRISESELRTTSECNIQNGEWCCSKKPFDDSDVTVSPGGTVSPGATVSPGGTVSPVTLTATVPPTVTTGPTVTRQGRKCIVTDRNDCPWLVKLYRGDDSPYCLGAMIGSKVILTTATCEIQARNQFLWATVPGSANPDANYTIFTRIPHPRYNSGNRLNDIALLSTLNDIQWGSSEPKGACIDPQQTLGGECTAGNLNEYYDLDVVSLFVTKGACTASGNVSDAMCGNGLFDNGFLHGTPIMCQKSNTYILSGITKRSYPGDSSRALLGNLDYKWLIFNLKETLGLRDDDFLYSRNYNF